MGIGTGIVMLVVGAVLAFAIHLPNSFVDFVTIGWILMGAGLVALAAGLFFGLRRKQTITTISNAVDSQGRTVSSHRTATDDR